MSFTASPYLSTWACIDDMACWSGIFISLITLSLSLGGEFHQAPCGWACRVARGEYAVGRGAAMCWASSKESERRRREEESRERASSRYGMAVRMAASARAEWPPRRWRCPRRIGSRSCRLYWRMRCSSNGWSLQRVILLQQAEEPDQTRQTHGYSGTHFTFLSSPTTSRWTRRVKTSHQGDLWIIEYAQIHLISFTFTRYSRKQKMNKFVW